LYGEGNSTILRGGPALTGSPQIIGLLNVNGWYIHDLQIDGNSNNQAGIQYSDGIVLWNSNNSTIQQVYVHNNKNMGIDTEKSSSVKILNNHIKTSGANGIQVTAGSNILIQGNTEDGSSDVGISISGDNAASGSGPITNVVCTANTIEHLNLGVSPYGSNAAIGIQIGDNGFATHVIVSQNQIYGPGYVGIGSLPGFGTNVDILISANQVNGTTNEAITGTSTTNLSIEDNVMDDAGYNVILIASTVTGVSVSGNYISASSPAVGISVQNPQALVEGNNVEGENLAISASGQQTNIVGNTIVGAHYLAVLLDSGSDDSSLVGNHVYTSLAYETAIQVNSKDDTVSNNRVYGGGGNDGAISITNTAVGTFVTDNDLRNNTTPISDNGINTVITGNVGYNPLGHITNPFTTSNTLVDSGTTSTMPNGTTITNWESPKTISILISSPFTTGHTFVLKIDGTQIVSTSAPTAQVVPYIFTLQPGETLYCQYPTGDITVSVSGQ
jgi:parallel beta-helix repeat protein